MNAYGALASSYDRLTNDVPYGEVLAYLERLFGENKPETVVDLACGTGSLSILLARKGYRVLGVDLSEDMLAVAYEKALALEENRPYFIHQSMQKLRLPYQVDCVVCCLDSLNYLTKPADCRAAIGRVHDALHPGGRFLFDLNTPEKLRGLDGQTFLDEDEDVYCVWRASFSEKDRICAYGMDLFQRAGQVWLRSSEEHLEYAYEREEILEYLREAGFTSVTVYGDRVLTKPQPGAQRVYFAAIKEQ
ncbi:MAG: class I SAM-dependent methyltransferase [Oscillospiraceae bacterium]|nr:class I SAM-dependent methyltransferase [Oscillospiraceae bacterium]